MNPYHRLNLKRNPFGDLNVIKRAQLSCVDTQLTQNLSDLFQEDNCILQFYGQHGRGKSTHLLNLHQHLSNHYATAIPYIQIKKPQPMVWLPTQSYFVDNIENLNIVQRLRLYRKYPKLVVATYRDLSKEMRFMNRRVHSIEIQQTDINRLQQIFNLRVKEAVLDKEVLVATPSKLLIHKLQNHCHDDIRTIESILYDVYYFLSRSDNNKKWSKSMSKTELSSEAVNHKLTDISQAQAIFDTAKTLVEHVDHDLIDWKAHETL